MFDFLKFRCSNLLCGRVQPDGVKVKIKVWILDIALLIHEKTREQQRYTILEVAAD